MADLAVLVIDINEGIKPQTIESINILKNFKTPFVIAANKIDLISGWRHHEWKTFGESVAEQDPRVAAELEEKIYNLTGKIFDKTGLSADRFDKITDFTKTVAIVPVSVCGGEGGVPVERPPRFLQRDGERQWCVAVTATVHSARAAPLLIRSSTKGPSRWATR